MSECVWGWVGACVRACVREERETERESRERERERWLLEKLGLEMIKP